MKWMWSVLLMLTVVACNTKKEQLGMLTAPGVSEQLAQFRSQEYSKDAGTNFGCSF